MTEYYYCITKLPLTYRIGRIEGEIKARKELITRYTKGTKRK